MARQKKSPAPPSAPAASAQPASVPAPANIGHNKAPLTDAEMADLQNYYELKIREAQRKVDVAVANLKLERGVVNGHFKRMTADLKYTRGEFEEYLARKDLTPAEYKAAEAKRRRMDANGGLPVGAQQDLLAAIEGPGDTADEGVLADAAGFIAGHRGDDPKPPGTISPILHPRWMEGWHRGTAEMQASVARAMEIINARAAPKPVLEPDEPDDDEGVDPVDAEAKRLKESGWADPDAAAEPEMEEA